MCSVESRLDVMNGVRVWDVRARRTAPLVRRFVLPTSLAIEVSSLQTTSFVGQAVLVVVVLESGHAE
jgi:hypothetical protein